MAFSPLTKALITDWETTGLRDDKRPTMTYVEGPQGIEIGAVVVDLADFREVAAFSSRIRFMGQRAGVCYGPYPHINWSDSAYRVHGIAIEDLLSAPTPGQVASDFAEFLRVNFGDNPVFFGAHNPSGDIYFTRQLLFMGGVEGVRFHHRMIDSFTTGYWAFGAESSDELFTLTSQVERGHHNALEDARLCANAIREAVTRMRAVGFGSKSGLSVATQ